MNYRASLDRVTAMRTALTCLCGHVNARGATGCVACGAYPQNGTRFGGYVSNVGGTMDDKAYKYTGGDMAVLFAAAGPLIALRAFTYSRAWHWFVRPVFAWAPQIGFHAAVGLVVVAAVLTMGRSAPKPQPAVETIVPAYVEGGLNLALVCIVHLLLGAGS